MKQWTIGMRITVGFASVVLITLTLGAFAYLRLIDIKSHSDKIARLSLPTVELISRAQRNAMDYDRIVYKHIGSSDPADMARLEADLRTDTADNTKAYEELGALIPAGQGSELLDKAKAARADYIKIRDQVLVISREATNNAEAYNLARTQMDPASEQYHAALGALTEFIGNDADDASKSILSSVQTSQAGILFGLVLATLVGVSVSFVIATRTVKILNRLTGSLDDGSNQIAAAAAQVSVASQSLAEGSGEQAASIEQTSASLEEMSSMTRRNAENAQKANDLAKQAREAADKGVGDMRTMNDAMLAIKVSSDDIAKIIKTIDEIAFQTNILALNAAVEAARAGEAGMGFAVVADEVRNLAQRSAQAAKETAAKIEGAIGNTSQGVALSQKVAERLNEIVIKARQVDELAAEVAGASREQTQGIVQANSAVGQMDKVTQANAASAEQSAAAAQELNAQAEMMKRLVGELLQLAGTKIKVGAHVVAPASANVKKAGATKSPSKVNVAKSLNGNGHHPPTTKSLAIAQRSEIPLENDFKDF